MITKLYEVSCDYCGTCINHYIGNKPTNKELINDGFVVINDKCFCNKECSQNYKNKYNK